MHFLVLLVEFIHCWTLTSFTVEFLGFTNMLLMYILVPFQYKSDSKMTSFCCHSPSLISKWDQEMETVRGKKRCLWLNHQNKFSKQFMSSTWLLPEVSKFPFSCSACLIIFISLKGVLNPYYLLRCVGNENHATFKVKSIEHGYKSIKLLYIYI